MEKKEIFELVQEYSSPLNYNSKEAAIILAAGHGKRIKSQKSKMLHEIWGEPTVERVYKACVQSNPDINVIFVVGIKAEEVIKTLGKKNNCAFAYQAEQLGTGHAAQIGLEILDKKKFDGVIYIFPGDMGLIDSDTVKLIREEFNNADLDMLVLTGIFEGDISLNYYGRIVRAKNVDIDGNKCDELAGQVIEIIEYKDILLLPDDKPYIKEFKGKKFLFTKKELLENREFNSGVYAFKSNYLFDLIDKIGNQNAQGEIYITDLIDIFNKNGLKVGATSPKNQYVLLGFNNKSVLAEMEKIARALAYDKLKDIIEIADPEDFFIADEVIDQILELDKKGIPLDIKIGKGVFIGKEVKINYNLELKKNAYANGNIIFGKNVKIWENVHLSCYPNQQFIIGDNVEILWGDIIKGNIIIGDNCRIESSVNMTGSDEHPLRIGKNVHIKGTSYIFGSIIDDDLFIERSVIIKKRVEKITKKNGKIQPIRFYMPMPEGIDAIEDL